MGPRVDEQLSAEQCASLYEIVDRPGRPPDELSRAWKRVSRMDVLDESSSDDVAVVLQHTCLVPLPAEEPPDRSLLIPVERPLLATAAHPRGYRGTKSQLPKRSKQSIGDLRPYLCDTASLTIILSRLSHKPVRSTDALPVLFVETLLPLSPSKLEPQALQLFWSLSLNTRKAMLAAITALFAVGGAENALAWGKCLQSTDPERREVLCALIVESLAATRAPDALMADALKSHVHDTDFVVRCYSALVAWAQGISSSFVVAGMQLSQDSWLDVKGDCTEVPIARIQSIRGVSSERLWQACGETPELAFRLQDDIWDLLSQTEQSDYFYSKLWQSRRGWSPDILTRVVKNIDHSHRKKALTMMWELVDSFEDFPNIKGRVGQASAFFERICRHPFDPEEIRQGCLISMLGLVPDSRLGDWLNVSDECLLRIEKANRRDNDEWCITRGATALLEVHPDFAVDCIIAVPKKLLETLKLLGNVEIPHAMQILRRCRILREDPGGTLEAIRSETLRKLAAPYGLTANDKAIVHALCSISQARQHRRAFKRFLHAWSAGQTSYLWDHPVSRRWLARYTSLNLEAWRNGIPYESQTTDGPVRIHVEEDPLEALRLGTVVGSCLGLGGMCADSAPAVMLDVNKQVVYARNSRGVIVGRQIVAISDDCRLVCFKVYPGNVSSELRAAFRDFDERFAATVGLPLHKAGDRYYIENILSRDWWDDGEWDFSVQDE
jgi:hypothetical protein